MNKTVVLALLIVSLIAYGEETKTIDFYAVLGITNGNEATDSQVKKQYKKMSKQLHPDLNPGQAEAEKQQYQDVQEAYAVLSNRKKRKVYDMMGHEGLKQLEQQAAGGRRQRDPFGGMFGFGGGGDGGPERGPDITLTIRVTLDDVYNGAEHVVPLTKQKLKSFESVRKCMKCKGQKPKMQRVQIGPGMVMQQEVPPDCRRQCNAGGAVAKKVHEMTVNIEAGVPEGHELNYELEADEYPDKLPGDVKFQVETSPHKLFKRSGDNLEMTIKITLLQALVGFSKTFTHMDDHTFTISRDLPTHHGFVMKVEGEGMPKHNVPSERGILIVTFEVIFPKKITEQQAAEFRRILE